ncbi:AAA family ATPase [Cytophagales bacterium LB-30]|uniref:AAA family ATPase n=1 Tax=Shiella aurantiaca TaxID=3058365 RepID=A0ABT8F481_9BACT|nr:AAA family ATPase [Shiella aurantiaca]MDN4165026.1 AAA family ATPase [Shiella aurantiaca]
MKESIHIKNLGPIKDIFIEDIKPLTVLIGESGSGKSTLMKAIALFRWLYKMHNIRSYLKRSNVSKSPFRFRMDTYFKDCGFDEYLKNYPEIIYTVEFSDNRKYTLHFAKNKLTGTSDKDLIHAQDIHYNKLSFVSETRNIIPLWAERGASMPGLKLGFYFHEVYNDFDLASENIKELDINYLNLKLSVKKVQSGKKYFIQAPNKEYELTLKNSSSGTQNAIPVTLIAEHFSKHFDFERAFNESLVKFLFKTDNLTDFKPVKNLGDIKKKLYIHIEEPELSLFPEAQCELISDLISKCFVSNFNSIDLIFSTHSPYIINHLNLLIKAYDCNQLVDGAKIEFEKVAVYQVDEGKIEDLIVKNQRIINTNSLSDTINNIYDKYNQLDKDGRLTEK